MQEQLPASPHTPVSLAGGLQGNLADARAQMAAFLQQRPDLRSFLDAQLAEDKLPLQQHAAHLAQQLQEQAALVQALEKQARSFPTCFKQVALPDATWRQVSICRRALVLVLPHVSVS